MSRPAEDPRLRPFASLLCPVECSASSERRCWHSRCQNLFRTTPVAVNHSRTNNTTTCTRSFLLRHNAMQHIAQSRLVQRRAVDDVTTRATRATKLDSGVEMHTRSVPQLRAEGSRFLES